MSRQDELRSEQEIRAKLNDLQNEASSERDNADLAQVRALRWVLKESISL